MIRKIPNAVGIDGYAHPDVSRETSRGDRETPDDNFGKILDFEMERRKHNAKTGRTRNDAFLYRGKP